MKWVVPSSLLWTLAVAVSACDEGAAPDPAIVSVVFAADSVVLTSGDSIQVQPVVLDAAGAERSGPLVFLSRNPLVAAVNQQGLVHGIMNGTARVVANSGNRKDSVLVVVLPNVASIRFHLDTATLFMGDTLRPLVTVREVSDAPVSSPKLTFATSDSLVVTVDDHGTLRTVAAGTASIVASGYGLADTLGITVHVAYKAFTRFGSGAAVCAISGDDRLYCWGPNNHMQLGTPTAPSQCTLAPGADPCSRSPIRVPGLSTVTRAASGVSHTCAIETDGDLYCWGGNGEGQVGDGSTVLAITSPTAVGGAVHFSTVVAASAHTCALANDGDAWCWGSDRFGQLGLGEKAADICNFSTTGTPCSRAPLKVSGGLKFVDLAASHLAACGLTQGGDVYCWGAGVGGTSLIDCNFGQQSDCSRTPILQSPGSALASISMTETVICGLTSLGVVRCWGTNQNGEFGDGTTAGSSTGVVGAGGMQFESLSVGGLGTCGVDSSKSVYCWGLQFGLFPRLNDLSPQLVPGNHSFTSVSRGPSAACGTLQNGRSVCWGYGDNGHLGNGLLDHSVTPVYVIQP